MHPETASEVLEVITMGLGKHMATKNYEAAAQLVKSTLDKKFGASWQCCIGRLWV